MPLGKAGFSVHLTESAVMTFVCLASSAVAVAVAVAAASSNTKLVESSRVFIATSKPLSSWHTSARCCYSAGVHVCSFQLNSASSALYEEKCLSKRPLWGRLVQRSSILRPHLRRIGAAAAARAANFLLRFGEFLQGEEIAHLVERFVAGQTFTLIDARLVLLVSSENCVVPILVAQHFRDVVTPARLAPHGRVSNQFVCGIEAVRAGDRIVIGVQFRCINLHEDRGAVGQRFASLSRRNGCGVRIVITDLLGRREVDRMVLGKRLFVIFWEGRLRSGDIRQQGGLGTGCSPWERGKVGRNVGDVVPT